MTAPHDEHATTIRKIVDDLKHRMILANRNEAMYFRASCYEIEAILAALAAARTDNERLLRDVDEALSNYGIAFTSTPIPDEVRAAAFEKARLALRRVRIALAASPGAEDVPVSEVSPGTDDVNG